ncbi:MAG: dihydrolipoyl dehydrogenase [Lachnospiraceae bacterium]|nr:dihydrolipoyl dehydrogenase [Lachnospiraceae bacterium]
MSQVYDVIVIGGGPGGYEAAIEAGKLGKKAAVIENAQIGGTCLNRGCIPTKAMMHTTHLLEEFKNCSEIGIKAGEVSVDFQMLHERKRNVVESLQSGIMQLFKMFKVDYYQGEGMITAPGHVTVKTNEETISLETENILIATGSVPSAPPIPGLDLPGVVNSDAILDGEGREFDHLIIIGGGVIGIEIASVYAALGTKVTIVEAMKQILPNMDKEISRNLAMIMKKQGIDIHTQAMVSKVEKTEKGLSVVYTEKGKEMAAEGDGVLVAIGRRANINGLFEGEPLVKTERGAVVVDGNLKTDVDGIYVIGDVVYGNIQLAHVATAQGIRAVSHMFGHPCEIDLSLVPSCIYTSPEIASIGMNADQAKEAGIQAKETKYLMSANGKSIISREKRSFIKVLYEVESRKIIGANMMCARATDMINEFTLAIQKGMTVEDMKAIIHPHPTYGEGIGETLKQIN